MAEISNLGTGKYLGPRPRTTFSVGESKVVER